MRLLARRIRTRDLLLSVLSALLLVLAQPPFSLLALPFFALVPLALILQGGPGTGEEAAEACRDRSGFHRSWRHGWEAAVLGLVFGVVHWGLLLLWIPLVVAPRFPWAFPAFGALLGLLGGLSAILGWSVHRLTSAARLPLAVAFPLAWVGVEWIKGHVPFGLAWPWMGLGVSLTSRPELLGLAEWVGESGVSFWLATVNGLVAMTVLAAATRNRDPGRARAWALGLLGLGVAVAPAGLGWWRSATLDLDLGPRVAVVGTHIPPSLRRRPGGFAREAAAQVRAALQNLPAGSADLVVLPEGTLPFPPESSEGAVHWETLTTLSRALQVPILVGGLGVARSDDEAAGPESFPEEPTNSAFLLTPSEGPSYRYDKVALVPGMEWGKYRSGPGANPLTLGGWVFAPIICYESLFGDLARAYRRAGGEILVNLTSDIWFGGEGSVPGGLFLDQHPAHLVLRAVENRMAVARAANGGVSLLLDPRGMVVGQPLPASGGMVVGELPLHQEPTLFARTGDVVGVGAFLLALFLALWPWGTLHPRARRR